MELTVIDWTIGAAVILLILYKIGTWNHNHFSSRGIKCVRPFPFVGSMGFLVLRNKSLADFMVDVYKDYKNERIVGLLLFLDPVVYVKDPDLIKNITVKNFDHFTDHQQAVSEEIDMFGKNLFNLKGERWRDMRAVLSPAFTSSKMRNMFHLMNECGQQAGDYLQGEIDKLDSDKPLVQDMKDLFTRVANDVIATAAFGLHIDSLKEKDNEFYLMGKESTNFMGWKFAKLLVLLLCPKLWEIFGITFHSKAEMNFFSNLIHDTITTREREGIVRPDMVHLLMQARKGQLTVEKGDEQEIDTPIKTKKIDLTENEIVAQAMLFFGAGFETTSTLLSFTSLLLALHQDVQKKLQEEVDRVLGQDRQVTYEKMQNMKYMEMVLSEVMRLYPPTFAMNRTCTKTFVIPASDTQPEYTMKKGDVLWVAVNGLHRDPDYFPEPDKFDPERFSDQNKSNIKPFTYVPFGAGPRLCIGQRFALLEAKVAVTHIVSRFNLIVVDKTPKKIELDPRGFNVSVIGGFWLGVVPRTHVNT